MDSEVRAELSRLKKKFGKDPFEKELIKVEFVEFIIKEHAKRLKFILEIGKEGIDE